MLGLLCSVCQCQANNTNKTDDPPIPTPLLLVLGNQTVGSMKANETKQYVVNIEKTYETGDWNLFVVVMPKKSQTWERTKITIYKLNDKKEKVGQINCSQVGVDACLMNRKNIYNNDTIHVDVKCYDDCQYRVKAYWSQSFPLILGKGVKLNFEQEAYAKSFTVDVEEVDFQELRVVLTAVGLVDTTTPIHLLANYGHNAPTVTKHDLKGIHLWDDGQGIFIRVQNMKERFLTILVEGPAQNILELKAYVITHHPHEVTIGNPVFDYIKAESGRTYFVDISGRKNSKSQDLIVKIAIFSGEVKTTFYRDDKLNDLLALSEYGHMGDLMYKFTDTHLTKSNLTDKIYLKVNTPGSEATFVISSFYKETNKPIKISTEISQISQIESKEVDLYYLQSFARAQSSPSTATLQFEIHNFTGLPIPVFYICRTNIDDCSSNLAKNYKNSKNIPLIEYKTSLSGRNSTIYQVKVQLDDFEKVFNRNRLRKLTLVILVYTESESSKYSLTNLNHITVRTLREGHPMQSRVTIGEQNYYRVGKISEDVKSVEIHLMETSGVTTMLAYREDPRGKGFDAKAIVPKYDTIIITDDLTTKPIYVITNGEENSLYTLSVSMKREQKKNGSGDTFNYIVLPENQHQQLVMQPKAVQIIRIHPTSQKFILKLQSRREVKYCATTSSKLKPVAPNCDIQLKEGQNHLNNRGVMYIGIHNDNDLQTRVSISFTDEFNCDSRQMGHLWRQLIEHDKTVGCTKYIVTKREKMQIFVHTENKRFDLLHITVSFRSGKEYIVMDKPRQYLTAQQLDGFCPSYPCQASIVVKTQNDTMVQIVAQYLDKEITLLDGVSQTIEGAFTNKIYKSFKFHMVGKMPVDIIVEGKTGYYGFYVNIIDEDTQHKLNQSKVYPTKDKHDFNSKNQYYTLYNSLYLTQQNLTKITCERCVLLISVLLNGNEPQLNGKYIIEVTQQIRYLKEHAQAIGYLDKGSMAFYRYYLPQDDRVIVVSLTTENVGCASLYLAKGQSQLATGSNYIQKSKGDELVYKGSKGNYSITVDAHTNCRYTISASSTATKLFELTNGVFKDVTLQQNQTIYLFYEHFFNTDLKLMSLENYGEVFIRANITNGNNLQNLSNETDFTKFVWLGSKDVLSIRKIDKEFCTKCLYLFSVTALKSTQTSLIITSPETEVPLDTKKDITDILNKGEKTIFKIYDNSDILNISVEVHYGQIKILAKSMEMEQNKTFTQQNKTVTWSFKQKKSSSEIGFLTRATHITITGNQNSMYKLTLSSKANTPSRRKIKPGVPSYIFFAGDEECFDGIGSGPIKIIVSTSQADKDNLKTLRVKLTSDNKTYQNYSQETVGSSSLLEFAGSEDIQNSSYRFCFKSPATTSITIIQVAKINLLPQGKNVYVNNTENFSLNCNGKIILEVFECNGPVTVLFSSNYEQLSGDDSSILQYRRFGMGHLVQTEHYGPVFLNVNGSSSIRWMHVNEGEGEGMGYYSIKVPHYEYQLQPEGIKFTIKPLVQNGKKPLNITSIVYNLIISDSYKKVKRIAMCYGMTEFTQFKLVESGQLSEKIEMVVGKDRINKLFGVSPEYLFTQIQASVSLKTKLGTVQQYSFLYQQQQIPWDVIKTEKVAPPTPNPEISVSSGFWRTLFTLCLVAVCVVAFYACVRFVKTRIRRRRADNLLKSEIQSIEPGANNDVQLKYGSYSGGAV